MTFDDPQERGPLVHVRPGHRVGINLGLDPDGRPLVILVDVTATGFIARGDFLAVLGPGRLTVAHKRAGEIDAENRH